MSSQTDGRPQARPLPVVALPGSTRTLLRQPFLAHAGRRVAALPAWAVVLLSTLMFYVAAAWYFTISLGMLQNDAVIRTAQASFVVQGRDPHLAAIGFVWTPLPALVQIPLVAALRPLGLQVFSGGIQSAVSMALAATLLWNFTGLFGLGGRSRALLTVLFVVNPMIVLYAATGMTEAMFLFFFVGIAHLFVRWTRSQRPTDLAGMGLMTAGAFGVRYEALPLAAAGAFAIGLVWLTGGERTRSRLAADLVLYITPIAYAVALWIALSYAIVGDGLYFLRGEYSAANLSANFDKSADVAAQALRDARQSPISALVYVAERLDRVFVVFLPLVLVAGAVVLIRRTWRVVGLLALTLAVAAFHALMVYRGTALHFLRYYLDAIVGSFVLAPVVLEGLQRGRARRPALAVISVALIVSGAWQLYSMTDPDVGREEYHFIKGAANSVGIYAFEPDVPLPNYRTYADERAIARYLDQTVPSGLVLIDTVYGAPIVLLSQHPERFVSTSDRDFSLILEQAQETVAYVLVPAPSVLSNLDRINRRYPGLYEGQLEWATLEHDWGGQAAWRLFRVRSEP
jgi:hypothetical protein